MVASGFDGASVVRPAPLSSAGGIGRRPVTPGAARGVQAPALKRVARIINVSGRRPGGLAASRNGALSFLAQRQSRN
jgi:hypothetical protein